MYNEQENPKWSLNSEPGSKPVPLNDAARIIDLTMDNHILLTSLNAANAELLRERHRNHLYYEELGKLRRTLENLNA